MIDEPWMLEEIEPSEQLDRRVERRLRSFAKARQPVRRAGPSAKSSMPACAAPFFPCERAVYVLLVAVYAAYAGTRAVQVFRDARAGGAVPSLASCVESTEVDEVGGSSAGPSQRHEARSSAQTSLLKPNRGSLAPNSSIRSVRSS
jgi:hypothetical protein